MSIFLSGIAILIMSPLYSQASPPPGSAPQCDKDIIVQATIEVDARRALVKARECVDYYQRRTASLRPGQGLSGWEGLDVLMVGYSYCSVAQIQAMIGNAAEARLALSTAEKVARDWSGWYDSFLSGWPSVLQSTRGFVLELTGDMKGARNAYSDPDNTCTICVSRLAMISLSESKADEAREWVVKALKEDPANPTAYFALARISEREGHIQDALQHYQQALDYCKEVTKRNEFMPAFFFECSRAQEALTRLTLKPHR
jgi:tetratricopeptide (TPR) repeat protein